MKLQPGHEPQIPESTAQAKTAVTQDALAHVAHVAKGARDSLSFSPGESREWENCLDGAQQAPEISFRHAKAAPGPDMFPSHVKSPKSSKSSCYLASFIVRIDS